MIPAGKDSELEVLRSLKNQTIKPEKVIVVRGSHASRNRNRGIERVETDFVAFVNAHSSFPPNWVESIENFFDIYPDVDVVGGPQLTPPEGGFFEKVSGYALTSKFGAANVAGRYGKGKLNLNAGETDITSSNLICRRKVIEKVKFDEKLWPGEDPKFICDAKIEGFKVAYSPDIIGYNRRRGNSFGLMKQFFNYGKFRPKFSSAFKNPLFLVPALFFIYICVLILSVLIKPEITGNVASTSVRNGGWFLWPFLLYVLLTLLFGVFDSLKNKDLRAVFVLPGIYPMIHLSYGAGMVWGYLRKVFK